MRKSRLWAGAVCAFSLAASPAALAAEPPAALAPVQHPAVVTHHQGVFGGAPLRYTATVEGLDVAVGQSRARIVSFAYTRDGADPATRPVIFLFNGGPISPSLYAQMGLGPKRAAFPDDLNAPQSSYRLVDNAYSPLDAADLVFFDPAQTGFSRVELGTDPKVFYSVKGDAEELAAFVRAWMTAHGRSGPVYLFGESYGTNRAAETAGVLAEGPEPFKLGGVFLYGQAVNIIEYAQRPANVVSYVASLPTLAATAWYHGRAAREGRTFEQFTADADAFAKGPYLTALYQGDGLPEAARRPIAEKLQAFTGISADWYLAHGLKITKEEFRVELLRDQGLLLGRSDARYAAPLTKAGRGPDPADVLPKASRAFFERYLRDDLKVGWTEPYVTESPVEDINGWTWGAGVSPFADWPYYLGITKAMQLNPDFRLVVANGWYDTMTTVGAEELLAAQSGWDRAKVTVRAYDGGHMGYSVAATAQALGDDIRRMVR